MTIVPFRLDGLAPTVVQTDSEFDPAGTKVLIRPLDKSQFAETPMPATYDLRIGEQYRGHTDPHIRSLRLSHDSAPAAGDDDGGDDFLDLAPGAAVVVLTEEEVAFPNSRFGQIAPRVSLLELGIANTPSKVDPGYRGRLKITVFNHGRRTERLRRGQKFCSLFVSTVDTDAGISPYDKPGATMKAPPKQLARRVRFARFLRRETPRFIALATAVTAVVSIVERLFGAF